MNNWFRLFLSARGAINRRTFWHGVIVITFINAAVLTAYLAVTAWMWSRVHGLHAIRDGGLVNSILLLPIPTIWFSLCVFVKRLRATRGPIWLGLVVRAAWAWALVVFAFSPLMIRLDPYLMLAVELSAAVALLVGFMGDAVLLAGLGVFSKDQVTEAAPQ